MSEFFDWQDAVAPLKALGWWLFWCVLVGIPTHLALRAGRKADEGDDKS